MTYLERGFAILLIIAIVSGTRSYFTGDAKDKTEVMQEKCWRSALLCNHRGGDGVGVRSRFCWVR